jgi:NhaP-type Na+/H+ or K+/H+ antiporter
VRFLRLSPACLRSRFPPELVLALFVAPVLLDAAYDTSLRDLRDNWAPVAGLVIFAVGLTTAAVALIVHAFVPAIPCSR